MALDQAFLLSWLPTGALHKHPIATSEVSATFLLALILTLHSQLLPQRSPKRFLMSNSPTMFSSFGEVT